jgi:hypothetical protein
MITQGKWRLNAYGSRKDGTFTIGPVGYVDGIAQTLTTAPPSEQESNARLIAAAPGLLKELSMSRVYILSECERSVGRHRMLDRIETAIAAAEKK